MRKAEIRVRVKGTAFYLPVANAPAAPTNEAAPAPAFNGASTGRRLAGWRATGAGPNAIVQASAPELVRRSRDLGRNNPHGRRARTLYRTHIVGTGIVPRSLCPDPAVREAIDALWDRWTDYADADGAYDFYGLQAQAVDEMVEGGESFIRLRTRRPSDALPVPLQLQVIPTEQVPLGYATPNGSNPVLQGIERNRLGQRAAYWMHRQHPGDVGLGDTFDIGQLSRVDAADVCHLRLAPAGQLRGLPWLAVVVTVLKHLGDWKDASLLRKQMLTMLVGFVRRAVNGTMDLDELARAWGNVQAQLGDLPAVALEPGTMQYLEPGEEVEFTNWQETAGADEAFERSALRTVSAGLDLIYEEVSGDWEKTNDRTFRAAFNTLKRTVGMYQHQLVGFQLNRPVWTRFIDLAVASQALIVPPGLTDADLKRFENRPQRWEYLNPKQDIEALGTELAIGINSRKAIADERGDKIETIDEQRAADQARETRHGLASNRPAPSPDDPDPHQQEQ